MSSGLLSLKWNNHRSTFFHVLSSIRSKESYCDATLACDGRFYPVHKLVLSTCSEYFEQIFERTQCKHPVIVLKDIKYDDLEALMNYMYVGEVNVLQEKLAGLIKAAECLKIKGLAVPDEDPTNNNKRNPGRVGGESPHAKRRRREDSFNHEDRERHNVSNRSRLNQRDQLPQVDTHIEQNSNSSTSNSKIRVENNSQRIGEVESDQKQHEDESTDEQHCAKIITEESDGRLSSQKPAPQVSIDDTSVKSEPPDIQEDMVDDSKETLHSNLGYDPLEDTESVNADPASVASSSNETPYSDSNLMDSTPQSVEDVVAQALPQTSSSFQGNSFSMWEGENSLQNLPGEGFSGDNSQGRSMVEVTPKNDSSKDGDRDTAMVKFPQTPRSPNSPTYPPPPLPQPLPLLQSSKITSKNSLPLLPSQSRLLSSPPPPPPSCRSPSVSPSLLRSNLSPISSPIGSPSSSAASVVVPNLSHSIQNFLTNSLNSYRSKAIISSSESLYAAGSSSSHLDLVHNQAAAARNRCSMPCTICSKLFPTPTALKVHIRTHTGEKPFSCEYCLYRTAQKGNLATHMRTHTGEKPFICSICSCRFKSGSALTGHMRSKH